MPIPVDDVSYSVCMPLIEQKVMQKSWKWKYQRKLLCKQTQQQQQQQQIS